MKTKFLSPSFNNGDSNSRAIPSIQKHARVWRLLGGLRKEGYARRNTHSAQGTCTGKGRTVDLNESITILNPRFDCEPVLVLSVQALLWASEQLSKESGQVGRALCTGRSGRL